MGHRISFESVWLGVVGLLATSTGCGSSNSPVAADGGLPDGSSDQASPDAANIVARPTDFTAGTRLAGRYAVSPNGARQYRGPYDTMLKRPCQFARAEDGKVRCLPVVPAALDLDGGELMFRDARCTEALLPEAAACAGGFGFTNGPAGRAVHRLGPAAPVPGAYHAAAGGCQPVTGAPPGTFFTLGEVVPASNFVEQVGSRKDGPAGQRIHALYTQASDGSEARASALWDDQLGATCSPWISADGVWRCLPTEVTIALPTAVFTYRDPECTRRLAPAGTSKVTHLLVIEGTGTCTGKTRVFPVGSEVGNDTLFRVVNGACTLITNGGSTVYHDIGDEVPASTFAPLREVVATAGRLQQRYLISDAGTALVAAQWDSALGVSCSFESTAAGLRCVPPADRRTFADGACSSDAARPAAAACGAASSATPVASFANGAWCARQLTPIMLGDPVTGGLYQRGPTGDCKGANGATGYRAGSAPLDLQTLEAAQEVVE
jgi:hypothetical protein